MTFYRDDDVTQEDQDVEETLAYKGINRQRRRTHEPGPKPQVASSSRPTRKTSYEQSEDVQRWLKMHREDEESAKPPFNPTFLASLRDGPWVRSSLVQFYEDDLITDVVHVVKSGKEATVYCCVAHPSTGFEYLAAKVYRPRMFRSLKNDAVYRFNRAQYDLDGNTVRGRQQRGIQKAANERKRATQVAHWIEHEFSVQQILYAGGVRVPRPFAQIGNSILMDYVGDVGEPAPTLQEVVLEHGEAQALFDDIIDNIELCLARQCIHGDLSAYNLLYWQGVVTLIDFAQGVDPHYNPDVYPLLVRDIERVCQYFSRYGVQSEAEDLAHVMWQRYMGENA